MADPLPPTLDPCAARASRVRLPASAPWLHEEVGRRMQERLQWIVRSPVSWLHWGALRGGVKAHQLVAQRYANASCHIYEDDAGTMRYSREQLLPAWWNPSRWGSRALQWGLPNEPVQMLWANMALHSHPEPQALLRQWSSLLANDGFLMFSCLGPDTLRSVRDLYQMLDWPPPAQEFTDMHDWGDMLVQSGFAEPVMDMEHITLTYSNARVLLDELRTLGRNLHPRRFAGLRTPRWESRLRDALEHRLRGPDGRLHLGFEIIYGHAFKAMPKVPVSAQSNISLDEMRQQLAIRRSPR